MKGVAGTARDGARRTEEDRVTVNSDPSGVVLGMRRHAGRLSTVLAVLTLAVSAAACGGGSSDDDNKATGASGSTGAAAASSDEKVTIRYLDEQAEDAKAEAEKKKDVQAFNDSHPNIQVKRESMSPDDIRKIINTRLGSNNPPDIVTYGTGAGFGGVLAKNKLIAPIDDAYQKYGWKIYDWAKERGNYGGKLYAVPDQVEQLGIYYNKEIFKDLGVNDEPKTLEDLEKVADAAKAKGIIPMAFGD